MRIVWLCFGWIQGSPGAESSASASVRYRVILPAAGLRKLGHDVLTASLQQSTAVPTSFDAVDALILSKPLLHVDGRYGATLHQALRAAEQCAAQGGRIIADIADDHFSDQDFRAFYQHLDTMNARFVAASDALAVAAAKHVRNDVVVIDDPFEGPGGEPHVPGDAVRSRVALPMAFGRRLVETRPLQLLWFGHEKNVTEMEDWLSRLARLARRVPLRLTLCTRGSKALGERIKLVNSLVQDELEVAHTEWSLQTLWEGLKGADAVLLPCGQGADARSANRMTETLRAGRLAIAQPARSYSAFAPYAWIGADLCAGIEWLREKPRDALERVRKGKGHVERCLSVDAIADEWVNCIESAQPAKVPAPVVNREASPGVRLNLGCGDKRLAGYVNVDRVSRGPAAPDVTCDIRKLESFPAAHADEILAVHVIEHFDRWEVEDILREWLRVLKPGGSLVLECPNIAFACRQYAESCSRGNAPEPPMTMWPLYGDPGWRDPLMMHRWGYDPASLAALLRAVGLVNVRQEPAQFKMREPRDMRLVAEKAPHAREAD